MNLNHLQAFCLVVKTGSITKAAKKLHISQPALSLQIQDLENNLQTILLERSNKGVKPTEMGEVVFNYGNKILNLKENMQKEIESYGSATMEELGVGASSTLGNFALPCSVYIFKENYPQHEIYLDISKTKTVLEKLLEGTIEIGVIEGPLVNSLKALIMTEGLAVKKIAQDELVLIAPYNEHWQSRTEIPREELFQWKFVLMDEGSGIRETIEETLRDKDISMDQLNIALELNSINAIVSAVAAERGISFLPKMALRRELRHRTLKAIQVQGMNFPHSIYLIYHKNRIKPGLSANFLKFLASRERGFC